MTTVSGVIFLYSYDTTLASVSSIHLDEQGDVAGAAAMAMLIVYISFFGPRSSYLNLNCTP